MHTGRITTQFGYCLIGAVTVLSFGLSGAPAQAQEHEHGTTAPHLDATTQHHAVDGAFVKAVRSATERFRDTSMAIAEGYAPQLGCVSGPDRGAMGVHFINLPLVGDGELDVARPEALVYEPIRGEAFRLVAVEYVVLADMWNAKHAGPPELMGQLFHLVDAPNRFGLPAFYSLHVWAWKDNPFGTFVNWSPKVSCDAFDPQNP
jgi:hypothetical protein